ncbi:MAG: hypothetical protein LQ351_001520 [Letrouitia transgressa]|nr:MAG: hypothetical protein LQ351_001520 [Letrouitia transgressa]
MAPKILPRGSIPKLRPQPVVPEMTPPSKFGIGSLGPDSWSMGSSMLCEKADQSTVADAVATWEDTDGTWCLRRRNPALTATSTPPGDSDVNRVDFLGNSTAVWLISPNVLCKAKSWIPGVGLEADTIEWVAKNCPNIPIPNVIYSWIDPAWQRSFCLVNVLPGITLDDAWGELSEEERTAIADEVTAHIVDAARHTSPKICNTTGKGILYHGWILGCPKQQMEDAPDGQPNLHPLITPEELDRRLLLIGGRKSPEEVDHFVFFHGDLTPVNIIVDKDQNGKWHLSSINDWECAGFLPKWYIHTIIYTSAQYLLDLDKYEKEEAAGWLIELHKSLDKHDFPQYRDWLMEVVYYQPDPYVYFPRGE